MLTDLQLREAAEALKHLHSQDLIHGDIRGSNVLVSDDEHALLTDFGLATLLSTQTSGAIHSGSIVRWQSPELLNGKPNSVSSDVWAFGMMIYEVSKSSL